MIEYSPSYMAFAGSLLKSNKELIQQWAQDSSNLELQEACTMLMNAAEQAKK